MIETVLGVPGTFTVERAISCARDSCHSKLVRA
jgi:hypothetical protein